MTDLVLIGIFILCAVIGYIVVKRSGGFLEQMLFQKSEMWYHQKDSQKTERHSLSERIEKRRKDQAERRMPRECVPKDFKAGIKHEWKASGRGPKQQVWKPQ